MPKAEFYIPVEKAELWRKFKELCKREGESASEKLVEWFCKYYDLHKHGNPQTLMQHYLEEEVARSKVTLKPHLSVGEHPIEELKLILRNPDVSEYDKHEISCWLREIGEIDS